MEELDGVREAVPAQRGKPEEKRRHHPQTVIPRRRAKRERPSAVRDRFVLIPCCGEVVREVGQDPAEPPIVAGRACQRFGRVQMREDRAVVAER